jgi:hypothetical protein
LMPPGAVLRPQGRRCGPLRDRTSRTTLSVTSAGVRQRRARDPLGVANHPRCS